MSTQEKISQIDAEIARLEGRAAPSEDSAKESESKGGFKLGKYAAMIPRSSAAFPGYMADLLKLGPDLVAHGIGSITGKPYKQPKGYGERTKEAIDKRTNNYAKPTTKGEKIYEAVLDAVTHPSKLSAGKTLAGKIGKTTASRIPAGALAGVGEATDSHILAGLVAPLAYGSGRGAVNSLRNKRNLANVKKHEQRFIGDISKKSADEFERFTHELAGNPMAFEELLKNIRNKREQSKPLTEALEKIKNNQRFAVQGNRAAQKSNKSFTKENQGKFYSDKERKELEKIYQTQAEPLGEKVYEAINKKQADLDKKHADIFGQTKQDIKNVPHAHTEDFSHLAKEAYEDLEGIGKNSILKDALKTEKAKTVFKLMGVDTSGKDPQTLKLYLKLAAEGKAPVNASIQELKRIGKDTKIREGQFNVTSPAQVGETKHILKNIGEAKDRALEQVPGATARKAEAADIYGRHMATVRPHHDVTVAEGKNLLETAVYHSIEEASKGKGHHKVRAITDALGNENAHDWVKFRIAKLGNKNNKFDEKTLTNNFLGLTPSEQRAMVDAADPRTASVLNNYMHQTDILEKLRQPTKTNYLSKADRDARFNAKNELTTQEMTPIKKQYPSDLFKAHKKDVLEGRAAPTYRGSSRGIIRDLARNPVGEHDIATLQLSLNKLQPEVRKRILDKLPKPVQEKLTKGFEELAFLNKVAGSRHGLEGAGELVSKVSHKAGKVRGVAKKIFHANPEKQYKKAQQAYEWKRTGTTPKFFEFPINAPSIRKALKTLTGPAKADINDRISEIDRQIAELEG